MTDTAQRIDEEPVGRYDQTEEDRRDRHRAEDDGTGGTHAVPSSSSSVVRTVDPGVDVGTDGTGAAVGTDGTGAAVGTAGTGAVLSPSVTGAALDPSGPAAVLDPSGTGAAPGPDETQSAVGAGGGGAGTDLPDAGETARSLALCVAEILTGAREVDTISRWITDEVHRHLQHRAAVAARARSVSRHARQRAVIRVGGVVLDGPRDGVAEAAVVVHTRSRARAVAIRLEVRNGRWRATAIGVL
ncbi:Rv3235 family protein [Curtobacterium sp. MCBD17_008]|uniref:Rv3235 family protein n=1 Tax=Curtobacterium sp. MCBD17_008 TaxID=2175656 RepID=UPI000DAAA5D4|nr:Rv3235 family protein [Curtobacterium sp. MCBD17_008]PZE89486.1 hypothetical protein DEI95_13860 [Curtobacterium sp. MCBD17_008]